MVISTNFNTEKTEIQDVTKRQKQNLMFYKEDPF